MAVKPGAWTVWYSHCPDDSSGVICTRCAGFYSAILVISHTGACLKFNKAWGRFGGSLLYPKEDGWHSEAINKLYHTPAKFSDNPYGGHLLWLATGKQMTSDIRIRYNAIFLYIRAFIKSWILTFWCKSYRTSVMPERHLKTFNQEDLFPPQSHLPLHHYNSRSLRPPKYWASLLERSRNWQQKCKNGEWSHVK